MDTEIGAARRMGEKIGDMDRHVDREIGAVRTAGEIGEDKSMLYNSEKEGRKQEMKLRENGEGIDEKGFCLEKNGELKQHYFVQKIFQKKKIQKSERQKN